jgi:hypothetical protein
MAIETGNADFDGERRGVRDAGESNLSLTGDWRGRDDF